MREFSANGSPSRKSMRRRARNKLEQNISSVYCPVITSMMPTLTRWGIWWLDGLRMGRDRELGLEGVMGSVFQAVLRIKATVKDGKVYARGVGDDTRNIEALLATIRALNEAKIKTKGDLVFVFTVEEETTFKGVKGYLDQNKGKIDQYVALDGGYEGFTYAGIGINWYRHHFIGPGAHTRSRTPPYSPTLPLPPAILL